MALGWDLRGGDSSEFQAPTCALLSARIFESDRDSAGYEKRSQRVTIACDCTLSGDNA
jgi:hypothetical protein